MKSLLFLSLLALISLSCSPKSGRTIASDSSSTVGGEAVKIESYHVGEIKTSLLSPERFKELYGSVWELMDGGAGRSINLSEFTRLTGLTSIPDARGAFLRMHNAGLASNDPHANPDSNPIGGWQADAFQKHEHSYADMINTGTSERNVNGTNNGGSIVGRTTSGISNSETAARFALETRPKNITVNFYIKVNHCPNTEEFCL